MGVKEVCSESQRNSDGAVLDAVARDFSLEYGTPKSRLVSAPPGSSRRGGTLRECRNEL